ncbi:MAG: carboxyl transferase domain-containing protein, partial [Actinomycetota bacterium]
SADFVIAEAGATLGFAGPRVAESISGRPLPAGSQTAEAAMQAGLVDALIPREEVRPMLRRLLAILAPADPSPPATGAATDSEAVPGQKADAWESFRLARHPGRPSPRRYLESILEDFVELRGDRTGTEDPGVLAAIGRFRGRPVVVAAIDRARPGPAGFRKAVRAIETAGRLGFPLVAFVDTPGADPTPQSEYGGLAASIARTFESILETSAPVVSIVTGEGGSGGALALACGDVIGIQQNAVFSVIAPEGAAEILYRDASRAPEIARLVKPTAADLVEMGLADELIPEPAGGAHTDPAKAAEFLGSWLERALAEVRADPQKRADRYRG